MATLNDLQGGRGRHDLELEHCYSRQTDAKQSFDTRVPKRSLGTKVLLRNQKLDKHFGIFASKRNASKSLHVTKGKCSL